MSIIHIERILAHLQSEDANEVAASAREICKIPTGDNAVREMLVSLLSDKRLCIAKIKPTRYAEVRWIVGLALSYERAFAGMVENVVVHQTFEPLKAEAIQQVAKDAGLDYTQSYHELITELELREKITRYDRIFWVELAQGDLERNNEKKE